VVSKQCTNIIVPSLYVRIAQFPRC